MPSELQRVAQQLLATLDEIPRVVAYLHDRAGKYRESAGWIGSMSNSPSAQMAAMRLEEAARRCEEAAHHLSLAPPKARSWVQEMVSGQRSAPGREDRTHLSPATWRDPDRRAPEPESEDPFDPTASRVMRDLPVRKPKDKTRGVWVDDADRRHEWISGFDEYRKQADDLAVELGLGRLWTTSHVEIKFAMFMRERGLTRARLILNNIPCDDEEFSCENLLKKFLPPGAKLTIYAPDNFKRTYPTSEDGSSR